MRRERKRAGAKRKQCSQTWEQHGTRFESQLFHGHKLLFQFQPRFSHLRNRGEITFTARFSRESGERR